MNEALRRHGYRVRGESCVVVPGGLAAGTLRAGLPDMHDSQLAKCTATRIRDRRLDMPNRDLIPPSFIPGCLAPLFTAQLLSPRAHLASRYLTEYLVFST